MYFRHFLRVPVKLLAEPLLNFLLALLRLECFGFPFHPVEFFDRFHRQAFFKGFLLIVVIVVKDGLRQRVLVRRVYAVLLR